MKAGVGVGNDALEVAEDHEAMVGGIGGERGAGCQEVRAAGQLVVEVGGGVGDDADGEVESRDGLECSYVFGRWVDRRRVDSAELAAVKEEEKAASNTV